MVITDLDNKAAWYAIRTKPNEEGRADINLRNWQVRTFAPKLREAGSSSCGSHHHVSKPLFSGYIFAHFNASSELHKINYTRGVKNVVSFGGVPISIDDKVMNLLTVRATEDGFIRMDDELKVGDRVRINSGPFANLIGIFRQRTKSQERVRILLDAMKYQSHLLIDRKMVERLN
jgi:transcriptional antiterminator RfaH